MQLKITANIYQKKHRSGRTSWMVRWKDPATNKWVAFTAGRTKSEAQIVLGRVRESLLKGADPTPKNEFGGTANTVKMAIELYLKSPRFLKCTEVSRFHKEKTISAYLVPAFGNTNVLQLNRKEILAFYMKLKEGGLANRTIHKIHFLFAIILDELPEVPNAVRTIKDFKKLFPENAPTRDINFLTPEEIETILAAAKRISSSNRQANSSPLLYEFLKLLAHTGLRRSEAANLKWSDVDEKGGFIHIRKSKTGKSRVIPLDHLALAAILPLKGNGALVFTRRDGSVPQGDCYSQALRGLTRRMKFHKRVDIHTFRHSFGSNKIRQGWGLKKVSMILGHADITTTASIYTHLLDGDLKVRDDFMYGDDSRGLLKVAPSIQGTLQGGLAELLASSKYRSSEELADAVRKMIHSHSGLATPLSDRIDKGDRLNGLIKRARKRVQVQATS